MGKPGRGVLRCTGFAAPNLCHTRPLQTLFDHVAQVGPPLVPVTGKGLHMGWQLAGQLLVILLPVVIYASGWSPDAVQQVVLVAVVG